MYFDIIKQATKCTDVEAEQIEDLMRNVIFKSALDWQTRQELIDAAKLALEVIRYRAGQDTASS
ncbi:MAG: hypothetical protein HYY46_26195 [Deltaproteobacteria bacterium]|nr:hypothetical protein [Deltaproteobacteria bacterium]